MRKAAVKRKGQTAAVTVEGLRNSLKRLIVLDCTLLGMLTWSGKTLRVFASDKKKAIVTTRKGAKGFRQI